MRTSPVSSRSRGKAHPRPRKARPWPVLSNDIASSGCSAYSADEDVERAGDDGRAAARKISDAEGGSTADEDGETAHRERRGRMWPSRRWHGTGVKVAGHGGRQPPDEDDGHARACYHAGVGGGISK